MFSNRVIYITIIVVSAIALAWWALSDAEVPATAPKVVPPQVEEEIKNVGDKCEEVIRLYERLAYEKKVLGNDYITPELERAYRRCT